MFSVDGRINLLSFAKLAFLAFFAVRGLTSLKFGVESGLLDLQLGGAIGVATIFVLCTAVFELAIAGLLAKAKEPTFAFQACAIYFLAYGVWLMSDPTSLSLSAGLCIAALIFAQQQKQRREI